jgi:hypothetical protein
LFFRFLITCRRLFDLLWLLDRRSCPRGRVAVCKIRIVLLIEVENSLRHIAAILKQYILLFGNLSMRDFLLNGLTIGEISNISPLWWLLLLW